MTTRPIVVLLSLMAVLAGRPASAGWIIDETLSAADGANRAPTNHRVLLQSNRMKRVMLNADGSPAQAFILDLESSTIWQVDYQKQRYVESTIDEFIQATNSARATQAQTNARIQEALKRVPPEKRKAAEDALKARITRAGGVVEDCGDPRIEFRKTGQEGTIAGYRAQEYEASSDGKPTSEVWVAPDLPAWRELDRSKMEGFAGELVTVVRCAPMRLRAGLLQTDHAMKLAAEGYAVRTIIRGDNSVTNEVIKAVSQTVPLTEFQPPPSFARMKLLDLMRR